MNDIIQNRLNKVNDLKDRKLLKNILYDVFENIVDYNMDMYDRLEKRIYNEIDDPLNKFYIYTCLDMAQDVDPISEFLHPMIPSDLENVIYNMDEMNERLQKNEEVTLTSVFMKCDNTTFKEILSRKRSYKGFIKTDKDIHEIKVSLRQCQKYIEEIEKLYRIFQYNSITWNTVNCPYAYKFVDIVLNSSLILKPGEKITEISIDLAEYEKYKVVNAVPLWNVKQITVSDKFFPMPAIDRINFDHTLSLTESGIQNGYMVGLDNRNYIYCKRLEQDLVIVSSYDQQHQWDLIQIEDISNSRRKTFAYELMSNKRNLGFIGRYSTVKSIVIRTKGEIARLCQSYEVSKEILFQSVEIKDSYDKSEETVDYNSFIDDNIRIDAFKKIMLIKFKPLDRENFLVQDKMSFIISEMQIVFPEYKCIGELV